MRPLKQPHQKHLCQLNDRQLHTTKDTIISLPPTVTMKAFQVIKINFLSCFKSTGRFQHPVKA